MSFLLEGINVDLVYNNYTQGKFPIKLTKNVAKQNPTFIYKKQIQKYVITGRMLKHNDKFMCYLCGSEFNHTPCGIPIASHIKDDKINIDVEGCYCSNECAFSMLKFLITQDPVRYCVSTGWLKTLHFLEYPNSEGLKTAPITLLKRFGGFLEPDDYTSFIRHRTHRLTNSHLKFDATGEQYQILN